MLSLKALNAFALNPTDIVFFIVIAAIIVLCVVVYFLIPVFNKKQYQEQRENLKKREVAFKTNIKRTDGMPDTAADDAMEGSEPSTKEAPEGDAVTAEPKEDEKK